MISPQQPSAKASQSKLSRRQKYQTEVAIEILIKLVLSWVLALIAIASLIKLLPYNFAQQTKLKELRNEVEETEVRVDSLRDQLNRNFDPQQTQSLIEEYGSQLAPNQSRIFWLDQKPNKKE